MEVLTTSHLTPEDFGLVRFPLDPVGTLQFYISAMEFGADKWVDPDLIIESGSYVISYELDSWYYNEVMIRDDFYSYKFTLTKTGFKTYTQNYSIDFLRKYNTTPLIIEMVRE